MHPILASSRRVMLYTVVWLLILALLTATLWASGKVDWRIALRGLAPACVLFAFICLTPWYLCRVRPLRLPHRAIAPSLGAALAGSAVFAAAAGLASPPLAPHLPLLFALGVLLYLLSTGLHYAAIASLEQRSAERHAAEARSLARESQLQALKFQLNPHFLFNSLHSIAALATLDGLRAREMCIRLSEFLRSSLSLGDRESIPLREELALARSYLDVERVRFGARLQVEELIATSCEDCLVPALLLQPLVENAVKHGIAGLVEGGAIRLAATRSGAGVSIEIENAFDPETEAVHRDGIGLSHVRRRLEMRYGDEAAFSARAENAVYRVSLRLPCESPIASSNRA
jgi:two-component system, LytTR family, sensor histidine kinase AlgZ